MNNNKRQLPLLALRGLTILPNMTVHFDVNRKKSVNALEKAMLEDQMIFLVSQKDPQSDDPKLNELNKVGTIAKIKQLIKLPQNIIRVLVEGIDRATVESLIQEEPYLVAELDVHNYVENDYDTINNLAIIRTVQELLEEYSLENNKLSKEVIQQMIEINEIGKLADQIAANIPLAQDEKQKILDEIDPVKRLDETIRIIHNEIEILRIKREIQNKVKDKVDKNQKEYFLREQLKVIHEELGDTNSLDDAESYLGMVKKIKASSDIKEKIRKEINKFKKLPSGSSEGSVIRSYIETLLDLPWDKSQKENKDIKIAEDILNKDHYGLSQVKERIIEHLAVRSLSNKTDGPIICFVGPPGTGKTSVARSIAKALNREYVRISLGGVRDEAEIRGHRKTYVGAMPGRIVAGIKSAGTKNPLILLDEIDKMSSDFKGDPSSALLEVLDPEQNNKFRDHYIEMPIDLSEVMFIATANTVQTIPKPLLDRMELIEINSYTENEKFHIASKYLIPKQLEKHGLTDDMLVINQKALSKIITGYTREAGVRTLERKIGDICRKSAKEILTLKKNSIRITERNLEKYLGIEKYTCQKANPTNEIGIARGLAWTSVGGDTLSIEVNVMPGKGKFELTGQLGDVMKESAQAGISYIRSKARELNIPINSYAENDIHIHIPEGAVPKDGPSAGITMATAMISAITNVPVNALVAMTGEITLRGRVLPVGGLKEKIIAAKRAGIHTVLIPKKNERDVLEISKDILRGINIVFVDTMEEVLQHALLNQKEN